jgi:hypothetical protein
MKRKDIKSNPISIAEIVILVRWERIEINIIIERNIYIPVLFLFHE